MSEPTTPTNAGITKKRNRISFVCQQCRKAKTKCDKEQPQCTRCIKNGIDCIYDIELQQKPRNPSKNAIIKRLEADLDNYKSKYFNLLEIQKKSLTSGTSKSNDRLRRDAPQVIPMPTIHSNNDNAPMDAIDDDDDISNINLYNNHPNLIINGIMKREVKPLAENYIILQDKFLSNLVSSVFLDPSKNSMITALTETAASISLQPSVKNNLLKLKDMLIKQGHSDQQKTRISNFINRFLQKDSQQNQNHSPSNGMHLASNMNCNNSNDNYTNSSSTSPMDQNTTENNHHYIGVSKILTSMYSNFEHQYLEDISPVNANGEHEYTELMKGFISDFEKILPPFDVIVSYKAFFYESIYPSLPFLDKESFEETLALILFPEPNILFERKVIIKLGKSHLRTKLENLCLLLVILKLSYISLRFSEEGSSKTSSLYVSKDVLDAYPIDNEAIILAEKCLVAENLCACVNENIICCLLYIWSFFVFSPEEGDFFLEHPTDILSGVITMLGTSIGLHRDPYDFPQLRNSHFGKNIINHRRLLWIAIVTSTSFESSLKGRHPVIDQDLTSTFINVRAPNALKIYLSKVKADMGENFNERLYKTHEVAFKRMQLSILISDLDALTLTFNKSFPLSTLESSRDKIEKFLDHTFPILDFKGSNNTNDWINQLTKTTTTEYSITLHSRMMGTLILLRSSIALFLHFESLSETVSSQRLLPYYQKYFFKSCVDCLTLVTHFKKFFNGDYGTKYSSLTSYNVTKTAQLSLPSVIFGLLSIVIRLELAGVTLLTEYKELSQQNNAANSSIDNNSDLAAHMNELIGKITIMNSLKNEFEQALEAMHRIASENLRFTYFSVFKMLSLCDVLMHKMKKGDLLTGIFRMAQTERVDPKLVKAFAMTLNVDLTKRTTLIESLKKKNQIINVSVADLNKTYQKIHDLQNSDNSKVSSIPNPQFSNVPIPSSGDISMLPQRSSSNIHMNGSMLDKLTSVASLSKNLNLSLNGEWTNNGINAEGQNDFQNTEKSQNNLLDEAGIQNNIPTGTNGMNNHGMVENLGNGFDSNVDFRGIFGGLDLFDYDFLFGTE